MKWTLVALVGAALAATFAGPASAATAGRIGEDFKFCPGKVSTGTSAVESSYAHRIRVDGIGCSRAKDLVREDPEEHGFVCKVLDKPRGLLVLCKRPRHDPTVRLRYRLSFS